MAADVPIAAEAATAPRPPLFRTSEKSLVLLLLAAYVGGLVLWPLGGILLQALTGRGGFALLAEQWTSLATQRALWNTLDASFSATLLSVAFGTAAAALVALTDIRAKAATVFVLLLPVLIPSQITALAWIELTGPGSPILQAVGLAPPPGSTNPLYSKWGIVLVMGLEHSALVFLAVRAALQGLPRDLVEAAELGGARPLRIARSVLLPLALPAVLSGAALAFVASIGNFGVPALLGIPGRYSMLTTLIFQRLQGFGPKVLGEMAALALILALLAAAGLTLRGLIARRAATPVAQSGAALTPFALGRARPLVELGLWTVLLVTALLPLAALIASSLVPALGVRLGFDTLTLAHYRFVLLEYGAAHRAFLNSFVLAAAAAAISALAAVVLAYFAVAERNPVARGLDLVADAPYAVPGTVLSIAIIVAFLPPLPGLGVSLYNTGWIILVAYLSRFLALALRPTIGAVESLDPAIDEAARSVGAGVAHRLGAIVLPLVAPTAAAAALLIFMQAFSELTVSALLWSSGWETLGVTVFFLHREGNSPAAAALAALSLVVIFGLAIIAGLAGRRLPKGVVPWRA